MHPYPWPVGTCHFAEIMPTVRASLEKYVSETGVVDSSLPVQETATEGPYVLMSGYKVRVTIEPMSATTFIVRIA